MLRARRMSASLRGRECRDRARRGRARARCHEARCTARRIARRDRRPPRADADVRVVRVDRPAVAALADDETEVAEQAELVRDGGLPIPTRPRARDRASSRGGAPGYARLGVASACIASATWRAVSASMLAAATALDTVAHRRNDCMTRCSGDVRLRSAVSRYVSRVAIDPRVDIGTSTSKVADLERSLAFWNGVLGFEVTQRMGDRRSSCPPAGIPPHRAQHVGVEEWTVAARGTPVSSVAIRYPDWRELAGAAGASWLRIPLEAHLTTKISEAICAIRTERRVYHDRSARGRGGRRRGARDVQRPRPRGAAQEAGDG